MPYIQTYNFHKKTLNFCNASRLKPFQNVFTIITGNNATGKSRLLNSIISTTLDSPAYNFNKIIAISNTLNNKFPDFFNPKYIKLTNIEHSDLHKIKKHLLRLMLIISNQSFIEFLSIMVYQSIYLDHILLI